MPSIGPVGTPPPQHPPQPTSLSNAWTNFLLTIEGSVQEENPGLAKMQIDKLISELQTQPPDRFIQQAITDLQNAKTQLDNKAPTEQVMDSLVSAWGLLAD